MKAVKIADTRGGMNDFQAGWDMYAAGMADTFCQNAEQVRGWWMALDADCTGDMCSVLAADGVDGDEMDLVLDGLRMACIQ